MLYCDEKRQEAGVDNQCRCKACQLARFTKNNDSGIRVEMAMAACDLVLKCQNRVPSVPLYERERLMDAACNAVGCGGAERRAMREELLNEVLNSKGKHEYEIWAVEDVLLKYWRRLHCT